MTKFSPKVVVEQKKFESKYLTKLLTIVQLNSHSKTLFQQKKYIIKLKIKIKLSQAHEQF